MSILIFTNSLKYCIITLMSKHSYERVVHPQTSRSYQTIFNELSENATDFGHFQRQRVQEFASRGIPGMASAGEACLALAYSNNNLDQRLELLSMAESYWRSTIDMQAAVGKSETHNTIRSVIRLAYLPQYYSLFIGEMAPTMPTVEKTYIGLMAVAQSTDTARKTLPARNMSPNAHRRFGDLVGMSSELAIIQLLLRQNIREIRDPNWIILPSNAFQDQVGTKAKKQTDVWDVSIYNGDNGFTLAHKIQVKSSDRFGGSYDHDISVVRIDPDLRLDHERKATSWRISREIQIEYDTDKSQQATGILDLRTAKLLDLID